jgi:hypothetical protein
VSTSWYRAHCGTCDQILILSESCFLVSVGALSLLRGRVSCQSLSAVIIHCRVFFLILHITRFMYAQHMQGLCQPSAANHAPSIVVAGLLDRCQCVSTSSIDQPTQHTIFFFFFFSSLTFFPPCLQANVQIIFCYLPLTGPS